MRPRHHVIWVSTSTTTRGGIGSYVRQMQQTPLWSRWSIRQISTHQDGALLHKLVRFALGAGEFVTCLVLRRPCLVHLHTASNGSFARKSLLFWVARLLDVPVIIHVHGAAFEQFHDHSPWLVRRYIRATLQGASALIALGPSWGERLRVIAPRAAVEVVPNAVKVVPRTRPESDGQVLSVLFLGRLGERKGVPVLLDAWQRVVDQMPVDLAARLTLAGDGEVEQTKNKLAAGGGGGTIEVLGWVDSDRASALLDQADVLVLPSQQEGQPMAVLEAMSRGVCVVASAVGGIPDMISHAESGLLVTPDDPELLADALMSVLTSEETRTSLGRRGRTRVEEEFNIDVTWRALDALYESVRA